MAAIVSDDTSAEVASTSATDSGVQSINQEEDWEDLADTKVPNIPSHIQSLFSSATVSRQTIMLGT